MKARALPIVEREPGYPVTRGDCIDAQRPCPYVSCKWHLLTTIASDGRMYKARDFDERDPDSIVAALVEMSETCTLDVADKGGMSEEEIGDIYGVSADKMKRDSMTAVARARARIMMAMDPKDPYLKYKESK